jgi:hypothetical protein
MSEADRSDIRQEVLAWLRVTESDRRVAQQCLNADPPLHDAVTPIRDWTAWSVAYRAQAAPRSLAPPLQEDGGVEQAAPIPRAPFSSPKV